jgi:hypothetical protein
VESLNEVTDVMTIENVDRSRELFWENTHRYRLCDGVIKDDF